VNLLDIKNFRKVEESNKHFTLEHPSGHKLNIAKKGLSSDARKQLEEMPTNLAKGGYAKFAQANDPNMKGAKPSKPSASTNTMPGSPTNSAKAFTEPNEMGTQIPRAQLEEAMTNGQQPDVVLASLNKQAPPFGPLSSEPKHHYPPCINPSCKSFGKSHPNCRCYGGKFAKGGEVGNFCDVDRKHDNGCEYFKDGGEAEDKLSDSEKLDLAKQSSMDPAQPPQQAPDITIPERSPASAQDVPQEQVPPTDMPDNKNVSSPGPSYNSSGENISDPLTQFQSTKDAHLQEMLNDSGTFNNEVNQGQIKPEHYFHLFARTGEDGQPTTLGKIGTAFGLMLGGIGSGLTHQPNAALTVMQNEIDNDLKAQELSSQNKQNFLKINQQGFMNRAQEAQMSQDTKTKAYALTKMQMNYAALHSLVQNAAKLPPGSPQRQQADQQLAMMNQGVQNENFSIADRAATAAALGNVMAGGQNGGGANTTIMKTGLMGPEAKEAGEDIEQKTIPGIPGRAQRPIPQQTRDQVQNMNVLDAKAKDLIDYAKAHEGSWDPHTRAIAQQKANEMVGFYSSSLGTSMTEGTRTWLDDQIAKKNPTSVIAQELMGSNSRLKEIQNSNNMRRNTLLGSVGLKGPEQKLEKKSGDKTTSSASGREMYQKNGQWYYK
jgi:hypothetical protein